MDLNGRVNPDCNYASNPYHECTETCFRRIAEGKGRKGKKQSDGNSGHNKRHEERKGNRVCHRAGNPYHECNETCFGGVGPGYKPSGRGNDMRSDGKKMTESRTMPPQELDNGRNIAYNSSVSMPPVQNGKHYTLSDALTSEIQVEDSSFNENNQPNHSKNDPKDERVH